MQDRHFLFCSPVLSGALTENYYSLLFLSLQDFGEIILLKIYPAPKPPHVSGSGKNGVNYPEILRNLYGAPDCGQNFFNKMPKRINAFSVIIPQRIPVCNGKFSQTTSFSAVFSQNFSRMCFSRRLRRKTAAHPMDTRRFFICLFALSAHPAAPAERLPHPPPPG